MMSSLATKDPENVASDIVGCEMEAPFPTTLRRCHDEIQGLMFLMEEADSFFQLNKSAIDHQKKIFARALVAARMGLWECTLPSNTLEWSDVVYDLFDLPRGSKLDRHEIVRCYSSASLVELEALRTRAISEGSGFSMDAEIVTNKGNCRWIRITATVETDKGAAVRIFGLKQDITEEKLSLDRIRYLAAHDVLTGLSNRSEFQTKLAKLSVFGSSSGSQIALLLIDLDGFKTLNDTFGHSVGDDCLRETSKRLKSIFGSLSLIARIGGDEFAVLIDGREETRLVTELGQVIVNELQRCVTLRDVDVQIGASVGIAFANGSSPEDLFKRADCALYAAKNAGRSQFKIFEHGKDLSPRRPQTAA